MADGILNLYKEEGMTSHDVVQMVRHALHMRRVGHSGTLDPMATGVLPVLVGRATRLGEYVSGAGKSYLAALTFGVETDTLDRTGTIVRSCSKTRFSREEVEEALSHFHGTIEQRVPAYSAVKVNGKKLYEYARAGIEVERPVRQVTIDRMELVQLQEDQAVIFCHCSKGTYIRQLIADLAESLGTLAVMTALERTSVGSFTVEDALPVSVLKQMSSDELSSRLVPMDQAVKHFPFLQVDYPSALRLQQGQKLFRDEAEQEWIRVYTGSVFLGIGTVQRNEEGRSYLKLKKGMADPLDGKSNGHY